MDPSLHLRMTNLFFGLVFFLVLFFIQDVLGPFFKFFETRPQRAGQLRKFFGPEQQKDQGQDNENFCPSDTHGETYKLDSALLSIVIKKAAVIASSK